MDGCIFCKIANKEIPSELVYEDETTVAFRDLSPQAPVHILVIPKAHIKSVADAEDEKLLGHIARVAAKIAEKENIAAGFRLVTNVGEDGGQTVEHLHFHLLGGRKMSWPPG